MKKLVLTFVSVAFLLGTAFSQSTKIPLIGSEAPSFTAETTNGTLNFPDDYGKK
jgi:peroxiredoxin (alkyl hydroperoxide reductase subunit C)